VTVLIVSTSTWVGDCDKNVSALRQISDERHDDVDDDAQYVDASVHRTPEGQFSYLFKSAAGRPYIRFTVPGETLRSFETRALPDATKNCCSVCLYHYYECHPTNSVEPLMAEFTKSTEKQRVYVTGCNAMNTCLRSATVSHLLPCIFSVSTSSPAGFKKIK